LIGLDTNILVRHIVQDDVAQAVRAERLIDSLTPENPGFVSLVGIAELYWVLDRSYRLKQAQLMMAIDWLLEVEQIILEGDSQVAEARELSALGNTDFSDCLIACRSHAAGCTATFTFDKNAAKSAGMTLL
jgi:predicted nucleic-acid-binding protein